MFPIEAFRDTLAKAVAIFEQHAIRFHLTGGITSVAYGEPRMTQDIDIVVENQSMSSRLNEFMGSCADAGFLLDEKTVRQAVDRKGMFQLLDLESSLKLDIYPRELIDGELNRSQPFEIFEGMLLPIVSRCDAAASKLIWISKGSHKSRSDLRNLYDSGLDSDRETIRYLAEQLGHLQLLQEVLKEQDDIK